MIVILAALLALPVSGYGAPYPRAQIASKPEQKGCFIRYKLSTGDPIARVANFYRSEAAQAKLALLSDTSQLDSRMIVFVTQPKLLDVVINRQNGRTLISVSYKVIGASTCRER